MQNKLIEIKPLRHFHGIRVSQTSYKTLLKKHKTEEEMLIGLAESESDLKICCDPSDESGKKIAVEEDCIYERSNHDKSFLFKVWNSGLLITEIHYFGRLEEYEFCGAPHVAWAPEIENIDLTKEAQKRAFRIFKDLLNDTEKINGFPITVQRHRVFSQPQFRSLLIRILNSNKFQNA